jgi:hypothetical protein
MIPSVVERTAAKGLRHPAAILPSFVHHANAAVYSSRVGN